MIYDDFELKPQPPTPQERERFEKWALDEGLDMWQEDGVYQDRATNAAWRATQARAALDAGAVEALRELVALKDLKDRIEAYAGRRFWIRSECPAAQSDPNDVYTAHCALMAEYKRRQPLAWEAARAALAAIPAGTAGEGK